MITFIYPSTTSLTVLWKTDSESRLTEIPVKKLSAATQATFGGFLTWLNSFLTAGEIYDSTVLEPIGQIAATFNDATDSMPQTPATYRDVWQMSVSTKGIGSRLLIKTTEDAAPELRDAFPAALAEIAVLIITPTKRK